MKNLGISKFFILNYKESASFILFYFQIFKNEIKETTHAIFFILINFFKYHNYLYF